MGFHCTVLFLRGVGGGVEAMACQKYNYHDTVEKKAFRLFSPLANTRFNIYFHKFVGLKKLDLLQLRLLW